MDSYTVGYQNEVRMARILLVLGASGLTGYKIMNLARANFEAYGTCNMRVPANECLIKLDINKEDNFRSVFKELKPDIVLNTIALHNVDYCESHGQEAYEINSKSVSMIADLCNNLGSRLIHFSTDFVFDGNKAGRYAESDKPNPLSMYAKSKLDGEFQAKRCISYSILRPSVIFGWTPLEVQGSTSSSGKPVNFALWVLSKLNKGEEIMVVNDQFSSPTLADMLAEVALKVSNMDKNEIYHVSGTSCLSRYEFSKKISDTMGYSADHISIKPVSSYTLAQLAKRPMNSCLDCTKLQNELEYDLLDLDRSLAIMRSQIEVESPSLLGC